VLKREPEETEEVKPKRESGGKSSRKEVLGVFTKISGQDSFQGKANNSRPSDLGNIREG
jgi:hypothetical protein